MDPRLQNAIQLRKEQKQEEALKILRGLHQEKPGDPDIAYQMAWTFDSCGKEKEAAPFYEKALAAGLQVDRDGAYLGLGSTYRCLGEYQRSLETFDRALKEFPDHRPIKVFRALTLFNLGRGEESCSQLLLQLLDTTGDAGIKSYDGALRFYSDKLTQRWS
jgi:tetratricopeptide (TPR) repeat protein